MSDLITVDLELDCRGLSCPLPVLKTKKAINTLSSGQILRVTTTDSGSQSDMPAWSQRTGNPIVKTETLGEIFVYYIKNGGE